MRQSVFVHNEHALDGAPRAHLIEIISHPLESCRHRGILLVQRLLGAKCVVCQRVSACSWGEGSKWNVTSYGIGMPHQISGGGKKLCQGGNYFFFYASWGDFLFSFCKWHVYNYHWKSICVIVGLGKCPLYLLFFLSLSVHINGQHAFSVFLHGLKITLKVVNEQLRRCCSKNCKWWKKLPYQIWHQWVSISN